MEIGLSPRTDRRIASKSLKLNKGLIASSGAIKPLARALKTGTLMAKENVVCALLRLSQLEENKVAIGLSRVIPLLENKIRVVQAGIMKPLVELMADFGIKHGGQVSVCFEHVGHGS
ncbi:U BOX DOMAIN-CONTAINING [Salix purpurea]|uniref:U BOX DOMAIN-CONTAINING n=1 Tax=Salix purpurea TaxID=77065 RepID=A0A9Q0WP59_SALPP|nr:U BOX DOMAIN-CONTAINING [Salix purpurea]